MIIRAEEPGDIAAIHDVVRAAFGRPGEALLVDQLRAGGDSVISLVAVDDASTRREITGPITRRLFPRLGLHPFRSVPTAKEAASAARWFANR